MVFFEIDNVKGFRDYLPPESQKRELIVEIAKKNFAKYGFLPVETPIIEFDELMRSDTPADEDEAVADRFKLKDRGGRNLGLRYEFTFQLARILKQNPNLKLPFRRFQIGPVFRDEPIKQGRTRQFIQCDADIIGDSSVNAEAECLAAVNDIFQEIGIKDYEFKINNRKLLNAIIESVRIDSKQQVMRELDKLDKLGEDQVRVNLKKYASTNQVLTLFKLLEKSLDFFIENEFEGAKELKELLSLCKKYNVKTSFSPRLMRGFAYYTGNIFEGVIAGKSSISGGGRYDKSVGKYLGRDLPAIGISFSLEALMGICEKEINELKTSPIASALLISISQDEPTIALAKKLRKLDISCIPFFEKPGKALEYANSLGIPFAVFIGEDEIKKKKFKLRDLKSGEEQFLAETALIKKLKTKN